MAEAERRLSACLLPCARPVLCSDSTFCEGRARLYVLDYVMGTEESPRRRSDRHRGPL